MPVTDDEWREREAFLLAVEELRAEISAHVDAASQQCRGGRFGGFGGGGQTEDADPIQQLCRIRNQIGRISSALNGSGVRQGTVYPPTATQRERFEELTARAGALMR